MNSAKGNDSLECEECGEKGCGQDKRLKEKD